PFLVRLPADESEYAVAQRHHRRRPRHPLGRPFAGNGKGPPGGPQNNLGPIFAIQTIPSYAQWVPFPTSCTCYRRTLDPAAVAGAEPPPTSSPLSLPRSARASATRSIAVYRGRRSLPAYNPIDAAAN